MAPTGSSTQSSSSGSSTASASASAASDQTMFLQLLVAQLENQDPLNPVDGTTFVTQLAEFQQLDTTIGIGSDVSSILQDLNSLTGNSSTSSATSNSAGTTGDTTNL